MTDIIPTPETLSSGASAAQIASARETWVSLGLDAGQFDNAMAPAPAAAPGTPSTAPAVQDDRAGIEIMTGVDKAPSLSPREALEMAQALRDAGMSEDKINEALAKDGIAQLAPDTRTDDEREYDRAFPQPSPSSYNVNYRECTTETDVGKIAAMNAEYTSWAAGIGLPAEVGTAVIEEALRVESVTSRMSEPARQLWGLEQRAAFERLVGGPEKVAETMDKMSAMLARNPAMVDRLHRSGALNSATVLIHLAHQADRLALRAGRSH